MNSSSKFTIPETGKTYQLNEENAKVFRAMADLCNLEYSEEIKN